MDAVSALLAILRDTWGFLVGTLVAITIVAMLARVLQGTVGALAGARYAVAEAISGIGGIFMLGLFGLLGVPAIVRSVNVNVPACGPLADITAWVSALIGAFIGVRLLIAVLTAIFAASVGGRDTMATVLIEAGETIVGMLMAVAIVPVAAQFFGVC